MVESIAPRPAIAPVVPAIESVCPYLLADDGAWRASTPAREHRCTAVTPPAQLAADKQRRLCLTTEHRSCATFQVATGRGPHGTIAEPVRADRVERASGRTVVRTAPLVLDHGRLAVTMPMLPADRSIGQYALVALMGVALAAILVARLSTPATADPDRGGGAGAGAVVATSAPTGTPDPAASDDVPTRTLVPTEVEPSSGAEPAASAPVEPAATPAPAEAPRTYKVKRGDTLSGIAAEFGTTVKKLKALNDISDPSLLRIGQVLELP